MWCVFNLRWIVTSCKIFLYLALLLCSYDSSSSDTVVFAVFSSYKLLSPPTVDTSCTDSPPHSSVVSHVTYTSTFRVSVRIVLVEVVSSSFGSRHGPVDEEKEEWEGLSRCGGWRDLRGSERISMDGILWTYIAIQRKTNIRHCLFHLNNGQKNKSTNVFENC